MLNKKLKQRALSIQPKIPEISVTNQMERTIRSVRPEYLGQPLKMVQFDRSGHFCRSDQNVPFHLKTLLAQYCSFASCLQEQ